MADDAAGRGGGALPSPSLSSSSLVSSGRPRALSLACLAKPYENGGLTEGGEWGLTRRRHGRQVPAPAARVHGAQGQQRDPEEGHSDGAEAGSWRLTKACHVVVVVNVTRRERVLAVAQAQEANQTLEHAVKVKDQRLRKVRLVAQSSATLGPAHALARLPGPAP